MKSKNYEKVLNYFNKNLWSLEKVKNAVGKWITAEEFFEITGQEFIE